MLDKHKETVPLAELIETMRIGRSELISFKIAANEAAEIYGFPLSTAALRIIDDIKKYNKIGGLKKELEKLYLQKYTINQACSRQSQALINLAKLQKLWNNRRSDNIIEQPFGK